MTKIAVAALLALLAVMGLAITGCEEDSEVGGTGGSGGSVTGGGGSGGSESPSYDGTIGAVTFYGPWGGAATELAEDPTQAGRVFAVGGGQVFRSTDDGLTWTAAAEVETEALSMLVLPDGRLLVGTMVDVLQSSDQGDSWQSIKHDVEPGYAFGIQAKGLAYEAGAPARIWIALSSYETAPIWWLEDGQSTWHAWTPPTGWETDALNGAALFTSIDVVPDAGLGETLIFATYEESFGAGGGVFCSVDSAVSFSLCSPGLPPVPYHQVRIYDDLIALAGGEVFGSAYAGIYYSTDHGASWLPSTGNWPDPIANDLIRLGNGDFLAATWGGGILRSSDLTGDWSAAIGFAGMEVKALVELDSGDLLAGPEQLGVYRSADDGSSWSASTEGINRIDISDACVDPADTTTLLAAISSQNSGITIHSDAGVDGWGPIESLPNPRFSLVSIGPSGNWYVVSDGPTTQANDGIYVSSDEGQTFTFLGPLSGDLMDHDIIQVAEFNDGERLVAAGQYWSEGEWRPFLQETVDGGQTWTERFRGEPDHPAVALAVAHSGDLFLAIQGEPILHFDPAFLPTPLPIAEVVDGALYDVAVCAGDASTVLAVGNTTSGAPALVAFISRDGGTSWTAIDFGALPDEHPRFVAIHPYDCDLLFLATWGGRLLSSSDGGVTWTELDYGDEVALRKLQLIEQNDDLAATLLLSGLGGITGVQLETTVSAAPL